MSSIETEHRIAIQQLVLRYCRAIDRRDFATLATLYADDSIDEHGGMFSGTGAGFVEWVPSILSRMHATSHQVMNHLIAIEEGDGPEYAEGEVYIQAYHLMDGKDGGRIHMIGGGRYLDKYTRESGHWQFAHRKIVADYELVLPAPDAKEDLLDGTARGAAGSDDPSSDFFKIL